MLPPLKDHDRHTREWYRFETILGRSMSSRWQFRSMFGSHRCNKCPSPTMLCWLLWQQQAVFLFIEPYARLFYLPRVPVGRDWRQTGTRSVTQSHCCPRLSFVSTRAVERQHREQPKPQPMKTNKHRSACLPFVVAFLYIDPVRS